jgi:hypothetical protein
MNKNNGSMAVMRALSMMLLIVGVSACTTTQSSDMAPSQLQEKILNGWIIDPGDNVTITTQDNTRHCCWVSSITRDSVVMMEGGKPANDVVTEDGIEVEKQHQASQSTIVIPIKDIVAVDKTELTSGGKTATAATGVAAVAGFWYALFILLPAMIVGAAL